MTETGSNRIAYRKVEPNPPRFTGGSEYTEWAARADAWAGARREGSI